MRLGYIFSSARIALDIWAKKFPGMPRFFNLSSIAENCGDLFQKFGREPGPSEADFEKRTKAFLFCPFLSLPVSIREENYL